MTEENYLTQDKKLTDLSIESELRASEKKEHDRQWRIRVEPLISSLLKLNDRGARPWTKEEYKEETAIIKDLAKAVFYNIKNGL